MNGAFAAAILRGCVDDVLVAGDVRRIGLWTDNDARPGKGRSN
jgi:hypothetical protein